MYSASAIPRFAGPPSCTALCFRVQGDLSS
jgi:hypothetical protein